AWSWCRVRPQFVSVAGRYQTARVRDGVGACRSCRGGQRVEEFDVRAAGDMKCTECMGDMGDMGDTVAGRSGGGQACQDGGVTSRSEEHTSELQSRFDLVCRLLLEKKKRIIREDGR